MSRGALIASLCVVLCAGLVGLFFATYEKETYDYFVEPTGAAARNPLLAAQRFLEASGYATISQQKFAPSLTLPEPGDTAVATFNYQYLPEEELDLLLDWVARGGHLILQIQPLWDEDFDPVFTAIGVNAWFREEPEEDADDNESIENKAAPATGPALDGGASAERHTWGDVRYDNGVSIDPGSTEPMWAIHDQHGVFAAQFRYARGRLTAVADLGIIGNSSIGKFDHAFLLSKLVEGGADGKIWLLHTSEFPTLWSILMARAGYLFVAGLVLLGLVLWWASQRFGPTIAPLRDERKAFIEHIEASGLFLWRHQRHAQLLKSTQDAFLHSATRRHPQLRRFDEAQRDAYLARVCGVTTQAAGDALKSNESRAHGEFLRAIQTLKTMWTRL